MLNYDQLPAILVSAGFTLEFLLRLTLVALVVIPVAACCDLLARQTSSAARHHLWLLALIAVLAAPLLSLILPGRSFGPSVAVAAPLSQVPIETLPQVKSRAINGNGQVGGNAAQQIEMPLDLATHPVESPKTPALVTSFASHWFAMVVLAFWVFGMAVVLGLGILGQISLSRTRRASRAVRDPELLKLMDNASNQLGLNRHVLLLENAETTMPVTWGVFRPVLLLPASAAAWSKDRLRMVLLHELMHVRRFDCLWQWLSLTAVACHWFNPLVWFAALRLRAERERACDDGVLTAGLVASDYAEQLLDISTGGRRNVLAMCAGIAMARSQGLNSRLRAIVDDKRSRAPISRPAKAISACVLALILVPLTMAARANDESGPSVQTQFAESNNPSHPQQQLQLLLQRRRSPDNQQQVEQEPAENPAPISGEVVTDELVKEYLPDYELRVDDQGTPVALVSPDSGELELPASNETIPGPTGYWGNPAMEFLDDAKLEVSDRTDAAGLIQLLHALYHGPSFVRQKIYNPREIEGGWLVGVGHDFENYPGMIQFIHPYEILVDTDGRVSRLRQRQHPYRGSADVYSNTITTVYAREVQVNRGTNYPEVLTEELKQAWAREQDQPLHHNSILHYPDAVISVTDSTTGERFYVESNGSKLFALNSDGATVRIIDAVRATDLENLVGAPVVRHLELHDDEVRAIVGKQTQVTIDRETGRIISVASD